MFVPADEDASRGGIYVDTIVFGPGTRVADEFSLFLTGTFAYVETDPFSPDCSGPPIERDEEFDFARFEISGAYGGAIAGCNSSGNVVVQINFLFTG